MKWKNSRSMVLNKVSNDNRDKAKVFLNVVEKQFSFLKNYGYKFKEAKVATEYVVNDIVEVHYQNDELKRLIIIHYEPIDIDNKEIDLISISLFNGVTNLDKELVLKKYLKKYKSTLEIEHLTYPIKNNKSSFRENMKTSISGYAYFLKDVGENLIKGKEWEDGLIYDWSSAEDILYKAQKDALSDEDDEVVS